MSIYAKTKGTELEKTIAQLAAGEAAGGGLYYALARIARGYGLDDVAETFIEIGNQETNHSGFYATLNGKYPNDKEAFWKLVAGLSKAEFKGDTNLNDLARKLSNMGIPEAAEEVRLFDPREIRARSTGSQRDREKIRLPGLRLRIRRRFKFRARRLEVSDLRRAEKFF